MIGTKEEAVQEIKRLDAVNKKLVDALKFYADSRPQDFVTREPRAYGTDMTYHVSRLQDPARKVLQELNR